MSPQNLPSRDRTERPRVAQALRRAKNEFIGSQVLHNLGHLSASQCLLGIVRYTSVNLTVDAGEPRAPIP